MAGTGHTSAPKGKTVVVHMRDGSKRIGKFWKKDKNKVYLVDQEPIRAEKIRTISIRVLGTETRGTHV